MVSIEKLTLKQMILDERNHTLSDGLSELPLPDRFKVGFKTFDIPKNLNEFSENLCYGQRLYLAEQEPNDFGVILRYITGYYYPIFSKKGFDNDRAMRFGKVILYLPVVSLYPVAIHLSKLFNELLQREQKALHREPTSQEKEAGIDRLSLFADLASIKFLEKEFNKSREQVMLTPYNECLVEFMCAKEQAAFNDRLTDVYKKDAERKMKH